MRARRRRRAGRDPMRRLQVRAQKSSSPGFPDPQRTKLDKLERVSALRSAFEWCRSSPIKSWTPETLSIPDCANRRRRPWSALCRLQIRGLPPTPHSRIRWKSFIRGVPVSMSTKTAWSTCGFCQNPAFIRGPAIPLCAYKVLRRYLLWRMYALNRQRHVRATVMLVRTLSYRGSRQ